MKIHNRIIVCVLVSLMMLSMISPAAFAAESFDPSAVITLTIEYLYEEEPISDARFDVYRVAEVDAEEVLTLTGAFADYPVELNGLSNEDFQTAAEQLYGYAEEDQLPADHTVLTDEGGVAVLSGLQSGVYLVVGQPAVMGDRVHYTDPQLVILPQKEAETEEWHYAVTVQPKSVAVEEELLELTVVKQWSDKGYEEDRPTSVTVHLIWNDQVYDTVVLSEENDWTHTWTDLLPIGSWYVREEVPEDYVVEVTTEGNTFVLLNSRKNIDQTGQLWWPVPVLLAAGLLLIVVGLITRRGDRHEA